MLEIINAATDMKNVFDNLINRLNTAEERIRELKYMELESYMSLTLVHWVLSKVSKNDNVHKMKKGHLPKGEGSTSCYNK